MNRMIKRILIITVLIILSQSAYAQEHRIGIGLGSSSGVYRSNNQETDLTGELLELPSYVYSSKIGFAVGFKILEFSVKGKQETPLLKTKLAYSQTILAMTLGYEFKIGDSLIFSPQLIRSYMGSSKLDYSTYSVNTYYTSEGKDVVLSANSITGDADLSGYELPIYFVTKNYFWGIKLCWYKSEDKLILADNSEVEIDTYGGLQFLVETKF